MRTIRIFTLTALLMAVFLGGFRWLGTPHAQAAPVQAIAATAALPTIDDFQDPAVADGMFSYGDTGTSVNNSVVTTDTVPGSAAGNSVLRVEYVSAGWGAGTGRDIPGEDWSTSDGIRFWFKGDGSGAMYRLIISDNGDPNAAGDTSERFAFEWNDTASGWRFMMIPWTLFFRDPGFQPGGAPNDGLTLTEVKAYAFALPSGNSKTIFVDDIELFNYTDIDTFPDQAAADSMFAYGDNGTSVDRSVVATDTVPGAPVGNKALQIDYVSAGWGAGTGRDIPGDDWSASDGISFWFKGDGSGVLYRLILSDNGDPNVSGDTSERFAYEWNDNAAGWQLMSIPWASFFRDPGFQPGGAPNDGLTLTEVKAYAFALPSGNSKTIFLDSVRLFGAPQDRHVTFNPQSVSVDEGNPVTLSVSLSLTSTNPVSVDYMTVDGSASAGSDFVAASGTVTVTPGNATAQIVIATTDDSDSEGNETFMVVLSNPVSASLTTKITATVTIKDNDLVPPTVKVIVDDFESGLPTGEDGDGLGIGFVTWGDPNATVAITTTEVPDSDVMALPGQTGNNRLFKIDINAPSYGGTTHAFENEAVDTWTPQDWSGYAGITFWLYGQKTGNDLLFEINENRNPGSTTADAQIWTHTIVDDFSGWKQIVLNFSADFTVKSVGNGAPNDDFTREQVHGWSFGSLATGGSTVTYYLDNVGLYGTADPAALSVGFSAAKYDVAEGDTAVMTVSLNMTSTAPVTVTYKTAESQATPNVDYTPVSGTLVFAAGEQQKSISVPTMDDAKHETDERVMVNLYDVQGAAFAFQRRAALTIVDNDAAVPGEQSDFEGSHSFQVTGAISLSLTQLGSADPNALPGQGAYEQVLTVKYDDAASTTNRIYDTFKEPQDWSGADGLSFWYFGSNSGKTVNVELWDNQITDTNSMTSTAWVLRWSDEFNEPAGTPPNPNNWKHEIGDGALNNLNGWGNSELQFYSDDPANASTDGDGNLVLRMSQVNTATTDLLCYYGPCRYTSARLISADLAEFKYGKIEARMKLPPTDNDGIWPAFWALGSKIDEGVDWPQAGEIDIMEYVSRIPNEVFGTLHGPGYSGGQSYGGKLSNIANLLTEFHTYTIEWRENHIIWYFDGVKFHETRDTDAFLSGKEWVYNQPFFLLLNVAIGGNFGGAVSDQMTFPQDTLVDYVRVYQAPNQAELFEASFEDNFTGWQKVLVPFSTFTRSADQAAGAPNDGLTLTSVNGYGFRFPSSGGAVNAQAVVTTHIDQVRLYSGGTLFLPIIGR